MLEIEDIDIERLRQDLINEVTAAMFIVSPIAMMDLTKIENASDEELIKIAVNHGYNLEDYIKNNSKRYF